MNPLDKNLKIYDTEKSEDLKEIKKEKLFIDDNEFNEILINSIKSLGDEPKERIILNLKSFIKDNLDNKKSLTERQINFAINEVREEINSNPYYESTLEKILATFFDTITDFKELKDENLLFELINHKIMKNPEQTEQLLTKLGQLDLDDQFCVNVFNKIYFAHRDWKIKSQLLSHFDKLGIKDPSLRFGFLDSLSSREPADLICEHIKSFNLDEHERIKLFYKSLKNVQEGWAEGGVSEVIPRVKFLEIQSMERREELAYDLMKRDSVTMSLFIQDFAIHNPKTRFDLFLLCFKCTPDLHKEMVIKNIGNFKLSGEDLFEFVKNLTKTDWKIIVQNDFLTTGLTQDQLVDLVLNIIEQSGLGVENTALHFPQLTIESKEKIEKEVIKRQNQRILEKNEETKLSTPSKLQEMLQHLDPLPFHTSIDDLKNLWGKTEQDRMAIAQIYAERDPADLCRKINDLMINQTALFTITQMIAEKHPELIAQFMPDIGLQSEDQRFAIAMNIKEKNKKLFNDYCHHFYLSEGHLISIGKTLPIEEIQNFIYQSKIGKEARFELAKEWIEKSPLGACSYTTFELSKEDYAKICLMVVFKNPFLINTIKSPYNDGHPLNSADYLKIAQEVLNQDYPSFLGTLDPFIRDLNQQDRGILAQALAEKDLSALFQHLPKFHIEDAHTLINFAHLAMQSKEKQEGTRPFLLYIFENVVRKDSVLTLKAFKELDIQDSSIQHQMINELMRTNVGVLCAYIENLNIQEEERRFNIAKNAVEVDCRVLCQHIHKFQLSKEHLDFIFELALKKNPLALAESIKNFSQMKDPKTLSYLARSAAMQNRVEAERWVADLGFNSIDEVDQLEVNDVIHAIRNKDEHSLHAKLNQFKSNPEILEKCSMALYQALNEQNASLYSSWACRFLEAAAKSYQKLGRVEEAIRLRLYIAKEKLIYPDNPLNKLEKNLENPLIIPHLRGDIDYGIVFNGMDSQGLKGSYFRVRDIVVDHEKKRSVTFNAANWAVDEIRSNLRLLNQAVYADLIQKEFETDIEIEEGTPLYYYPKIEGNYDTGNLGKVGVGPGLTVKLKGLGQVKMGIDKEWGSQVDRIQITLDSPGSVEQLQKILALMGMTKMLTPSTEEDTTRLKVNFLIHFLYPKVAVLRDRQEDYHTKPIPELLAGLENNAPGITNKIYKYLDQVEMSEIDGVRRPYLATLSDQAEYLGAKGLYTGISGKGIEEAAGVIAMLVQSGFFPTLERLELGWVNTAGASMSEDLQSGGANATFFRLVTGSALDQKQVVFNDLYGLTGHIQVLLKTDVLNWMPYMHRKDSFGCRNPDSSKILLVDAYENRPNLKEFVKANEQTWLRHNEVMFKHRVEPKYIGGITYQDPRKMLIADLEESLIQNASTLLDEQRNFFNGYNTLEEKVEFVSTHPEKVKELVMLLPGYDASQDQYKRFSVERHWTLNPKKVIIDALMKAGIDPQQLNISIMEVDYFNEEMFKDCHFLEQRLIIMKDKVNQIVGEFKTTSKLGTEICADTSKFIDEIRDHFKTFSEDQLNEYITEESREKIKNLRDMCQKSLYDLSFSGQDSLNRELLTSKWNSVLRDKSVILALFALEAIRNQNKNADTNCLIEFNAYKGSGERIIETISDCIYYGIKEHHPCLLEKLPNNKKPKEHSKLANQLDFSKEYLRRSNIERTFLPVLTAINDSYTLLLGKKPDLSLNTKSEFNKPYGPGKWKTEYLENLKKILKFIDEKKDEELLKLSAIYTPEELKAQAYHGLQLLLQAENCHSEEMTTGEIIEVITKSPSILDPTISHAFYDRLHLLAALKSDQAILTKEGPIPIRELMIALMNRFAQGVNDQNALAAEQFYLRLTFLYEKLNLNQERVYA